MQIDQGHWSDTRLDGLRFVGIRGQFTKVEARQRLSSMPERGKPQRGALLRIVTGQDTEPSATIFQVFSATFKTLHEPIFASLRLRRLRRECRRA